MMMAIDNIPDEDEWIAAKQSEQEEAVHNLEDALGAYQRAVDLKGTTTGQGRMCQILNSGLYGWLGDTATVKDLQAEYQRRFRVVQDVKE